MHLYKILFLLMIVTLSSCRKDEIFEPIDSEIEIPSPENVDDNLINGTINDDAFRPLSDVTVQLYDSNILIEETQTTSDGSFYFIVDEIKDYLVYVVSFEFQDVLITVNPADSDNEVLLNLQLSEGVINNWDISSYEWVTIEGAVKNKDGSAAANVNINFIDITGSFFNYTTTDSQGKYISTIPANIPIVTFADQDCGTQDSSNIILTSEDTFLDDIVLDVILTTVIIEGAVTDCDFNLIENGEISFYDNSDFFSQFSQGGFIRSELITDGQYNVELENICSEIIYYEAYDYESNEIVFGEIDLLDSIIITENIEICGISQHGGTVDLNVNSSTYSLINHYAFRYNNHMNIFGFEPEDGVCIEFEAVMTEGTYDVDRIVIIVDDREYYDFGIGLKIVIEEYPNNSQGSLKGSVEGDIYDDQWNRVPFDLQFDIPLF